MAIGKYVAIPLLMAGAFYGGTKFAPQQKYATFEKDHDWFLETPLGVMPIYENHQVGTVEQRMRGLLEEEVSVLASSLAKIRQDAKDMSDID